MPDSSSPLSLSLRVTAAGKFLQLDGEPWLLKGVAYGPFDGDDSLPSPDQVDRDLRQIAALGCNTLRIYMPPPRWFLEACAAAGIRLLIGWPWPLHTDFLRTRRGAAAIIKTARDVVRSLRGAPAVLGFLVGNEIPADMVRWMGPARVQRFLERVIATCREEAPEALFGYASYPSTEYLNPRNADFVSCNIYLEDRAALARYLMRLQHVTGDRPLVIGEFGMDTHSYGAARQAGRMRQARPILRLLGSSMAIRTSRASRTSFSSVATLTPAWKIKGGGVILLFGKSWTKGATGRQ